MESVVRRKQYNTASAGDTDTLNDRNLNTDSNNSTAKLMSSEPEFSHGLLILKGLIPTILIIFAFGGRPSILILCLGTLISYIFDLLGTVEVC